MKCGNEINMFNRLQDKSGKAFSCFQVNKQAQMWGYNGQQIKGIENTKTHTHTHMPSSIASPRISTSVPI